MGPFQLAFSQHAEKAGADANKVVRQVTLEVISRIIVRSPVGDANYWSSPKPPGYVGGRFRANWRVAVGGPATGTTEAVDTSEGGGETLAGIASAMPAKAAGAVLHFTNNLPYGPRIENGWSKRQAPFGMVGLTVLEFQSIADNVAGSLGGQGVP